MSVTRNNLLVTAAFLLAGIISYLYNPWLIAPRLGPEGIAILGTFLYLHYALSFPLRPIEMTVIRFASHYHAGNRRAELAHLISVLLRTTAKYALLMLGLTAILSPWIAKFLNLESLLPVLAAVALAYFSYLRSVVWMTLQGLQRFGPYAVVALIDPLARTAAGSMLIYAGWKMSGAILGYLIGYLAAFAAAVWILRDLVFESKKKDSRPAAMLRYSIPIWIYSLYFAASMSLDGLMAKHYFPDAEAGLYVAATTIGKIMFIFIMPMGGVSFSMMCREVSSRRSPTGTLINTLALAAAGITILIVLFIFFSESVIRLTYGRDFAQAAALLPLAGIAYVPLAFIFLTAGYFFAKGMSSFIHGLFLGLAVELAMILSRHRSLHDILAAVAVGGLCQVFFAWLTSRASKGRPFMETPTFMDSELLG